VNSRNIRIARLNRKVSDLVFEQQVIVTVSAVVNLYWDLVSFNEDLRVKRQALALAQKLYEDNKKQVEIGTLAKIEVARAEAEMASREQDVTVSETSVLQQEAVLKNALTRSGAATATVYSARIVPTDSLRLNLEDPIPPLPELMDTALEHRPELKQTRLSIETSRIGLGGSRSQLLPTLDLQAAFTNNALAGDPNYLKVGQPGFVPPIQGYVGGFGEALAQIFRRNYPDYSIGFQLNVPLRNRLAQADYARDSLTLRQTELRERQQMNQIRVDVQNAQIGLTQIRAQYLAARKTRELQVLALDAEQKKFQAGASTNYLVIQAQRDLATAEGGEVSALANYKRAQTQMELVTGQTLVAHNIRLEEARVGSVNRPPDIPRP
jgi:outer membrane protein